MPLPVEARPKADVVVTVAEERLVEVPVYTPKPKEVTAIVDKIVEQPVDKDIEKVYEHVEVREIQVPVEKIEQKIVTISVPKTIERIVERVVEEPYDRFVEKTVTRTVERIVEKPYDKVIKIKKFTPVEKTVEKVVEVPVEKVIIKRVEVPYDRVVEKIVEVPMERMVEKRVEAIYDRVEERVVHVPHDVIVEKVVEVEVEDEIVEVPVQVEGQLVHQAPHRITLEDQGYLHRGGYQSNDVTLLNSSRSVVLPSPRTYTSGTYAGSGRYSGAYGSPRVISTGDYVGGSTLSKIQATEALQSIRKSDLTELKSLANPPAPIKNLLSTVMILLGKKDDWTTAKAQMATSDFINRLLDFDGTISSSAMKKLDKYFKDPHFTYAQIEMCSRAGAGLFKWVSYWYQFKVGGTRYYSSSQVGASPRITPRSYYP